MNRRHASVLFLLGLLFAEGYAIAPVRPANDLRVTVTIVCADAAVEIHQAPRGAGRYPERSAGPACESPAPPTARAFALFQRPPPFLA